MPSWVCHGGTTYRSMGSFLSPIVILYLMIVSSLPRRTWNVLLSPRVPSRDSYIVIPPVFLRRPHWTSRVALPAYWVPCGAKVRSVGTLVAAF